MKLRALTIALIAPLLVPLAATASDWNNVVQSCGHRRPSGRTGEKWLETCIIDVFTLQPVHPAVGSIAPITGTGFGLGLDRPTRTPLTASGSALEFLPSARALISTDGSVLFNGSLRIGFAPLGTSGLGLPASDTGDLGRWQTSDQSASYRGRELDAKAVIAFHAEQYDLRRQHFYGEGNSTTQSGLAIYRYRQTSGGVSLSNPVTRWLSAQVAVDYIAPSVRGASQLGRPSMQDVYNESVAPALIAEPKFVRVNASLRAVFKPLFAEFIEIQSAHAFYHATQGEPYSFRQFSGSLTAVHKIRIQRAHTGSHYNALANAICTPLPAKECSPGSVSVRSFATTSQTNGANAVPFYFQPILGGTTANGEDTIRGYRDYRFRAPNAIGLQTEFDHQIWGPFGILGFYDVGRVARDVSDLVSAGFHHAVGVGITVSASNLVVFRVFVGFGTGEGIRPNPKFGGGFL